MVGEVLVSQPIQLSLSIQALTFAGYGDFKLYRRVKNLRIGILKYGLPYWLHAEWRDAVWTGYAKFSFTATPQPPLSGGVIERS